MNKKTKKDEVQIRCSCAIGDLSDMAELKPEKKLGQKSSRKFKKRMI